MRSRILGLASVVGLVAVAAAAAAAGTPSTERPSVPRPEGPLPVGVSTLSLVDRARGARRILADVYYPSRSGDGRHARYLPDRVAEALATKTIPARSLTSIKTNAVRNGTPRSGRFPVLVFSPGYSVPHYLYTGLLEDLASRGYVVVAVDHTYETEAVTFPDGTTIRRTLPADPRNLISRAIRARVRDVHFVLGRLPALRRLSAFRSADLAKIGLLGHSLGGLTAANVAAERPFVGCAADIAGSIYGAARRRPFRRPFLIIDGAERESTLAGWWRNLRAARYWVTLRTAEHLNFTDWTWIVPALRARGLRPQVANLGHVDGSRALELERSYVAAFFDECLKQRASGAFANASPYSDVTIRR